MARWLLITFLLTLTGCGVQTAIKTELALIHNELRQMAGRDVINGLSSHGIVAIVVVAWVIGGVCFIAYRWDRNRSNRIITERAVRKANAAPDQPEKEKARA